jgi:putative transposase
MYSPTMDDNPFNRTYPSRRLKGFDYSDSSHAYFVTMRSRQGAPFGNTDLADGVISSLNWLRINRGLKIYSYCLMPDHLHLLLELPDGPDTLGTMIGAFKRFTARESWKHGLSGALWQPRFHDRILRDTEKLRTVGTYILANPVRKGLVRDEQDYEYSGCPDPW